MTYRRYAIERIAASLAILFLAASLTYAFFHVIGPGDARGRLDTRAAIERYRHYERESYGDFLWQLVGHGSLDRDLYDGTSLTGSTFGLAPVTLSLVDGAIVFGLLVGVPLGLVWSYRRRLGRLVSAPFVHLGLALFPIWVGLWLTYFFSYKVELALPGYCNFFGTPPKGGCGGLVDWARHLILPSITFGLAVAAVYAGVTKRLMRHIGEEEDKQAARRSATIAGAKLVARNASWLIGATLFVEAIFGLPGLGSSFVESVYGDPPRAESILLVATILAVGLALVVDLVAAAFVRDWRTT